MAKSYEPWWVSKEPHEGLASIFNRLESTIECRDADFRRFLSLYMNRKNIDFQPGDGNGGTTDVFRDILGARRVKLNTVESCISTLASRISSQRPKATFSTSCDNGKYWALKEKSKGLEKFVEGEFNRLGVYSLAQQCYIDAAIFGLGALKVCERFGKVHVERVFPAELIVDEQACLTTSPREIYHRKWITRDVAIARYGDTPAKIEALEECETREVQRGEAGTESSDLIAIKEGWHLPSGPGAGDGRHVIATDNYTLASNKYTKDEFPFVFYRWTEPVIGFWPQGLVEMQEPMQDEVNKLLGRIQDAMHFFSVAKLVTEEGAIDEDKMRNITGDIITYKRGQTPPQVYMPQSVSSEVFRYVWEINNRIYENTGVSQMSAASIKPAGVESGVALRTLQDVETGRHAMNAQKWDSLFIDITRQIIRVAREIYAKKGTYKTKFAADKFVETIDWKNISLDDDLYEIQIFPSNMLPQTPAGRLETVERLIQGGFIDPKQAMDLLDFPDLQQFQSLAGAAKDDIDRQIGQIEQGKQELPEPYQDIRKGLALMTSARLRAKIDGAPDTILSLFDDWIEAANRILEQEEQAMMQQQAQQAMMQQQGQGGQGAG